MASQNNSQAADRLLLVLYFSIYILCSLTLIFLQPFGNPPDEYARFLIPKYIADYGTLPNGFEEEIRIIGYGFSYAFQPILPYIFHGIVFKIARDAGAEFLTCIRMTRMVNFLSGLLMAYYVLRLGKLWFRDRRLQYLFSYLVMFLPQSLFLHTYINTDSFNMLSISMILYALTLGILQNFPLRSCLTLAAGIILCALSYYNSYGYILSSILLFCGFFLYREREKYTFDFKTFIRKGLLISVLVLLGIGWWFGRSYLLYDGDFLGLRTRDYCASLYAVEELRPGSRHTFYHQGFSLWYMLTHSDYIPLTLNSFIAMFGAMDIPTATWIYRFYKILFAAGISLCASEFLFTMNSSAKPEKLPATTVCENATNTVPADTVCQITPRTGLRRFYHANLILCIAIPCVLSLIYSYRTDYQPQGRYILPGLLPLCYYSVRGISAAFSRIIPYIVQKKPAQKPMNPTVFDRLFTGISAILTAGILLALLVTLYGYALPAYAQVVW